MKNKASIFSGFFVMLVAIIFFAYSLMYPYTSDLGPGPGFLPLWLSGILFILSVSYLYVSFRGEDSAEPMPDRQGQKSILFILLCMVMFLVMLPLLGFIIAGTVFLHILLVKSYKWPVALSTAIGTSVFLFVLFDIFLKVNLPVSMLGF